MRSKIGTWARCRRHALHDPCSQSRMAHRWMYAQVFFWDRRTGKLPVSCVGARHASGRLTSLQAVPDGRVIYAGTVAGEVRVALDRMAQTDM